MEVKRRGGYSSDLVCWPDLGLGGYEVADSNETYNSWNQSHINGIEQALSAHLKVVVDPAMKVIRVK